MVGKRGLAAQSVHLKSNAIRKSHNVQIATKCRVRFRTMPVLLGEAEQHKIGYKFTKLTIS